MSSPIQIDHIVLLLDTASFENPPPWLRSNFIIVEGGKHTGQASRNKLIFFKDGTYLELFNWYDEPPSLEDEKQPMRVWGAKKEGLIDFALTSTTVEPEACVGGVNGRLFWEEGKDGGLGVKYPQPVAGGRTRADGVEVRWKVTRPVFQEGDNIPGESFFPGGRLDAPFFCHDVTERKVRVASDEEEKTIHPCGATGIFAVVVLVPADKINAYVTLYSKILGANPDSFDDEHGATRFRFQVRSPAGGPPQSYIEMRQARSEEEIKQMRDRGVGISDIVLATEDSAEGKRKQFGGDGIASTIWLT